MPAAWMASKWPMSPAHPVPCVPDVACAQPQMLLFHPAMKMILRSAGSHHKKQDDEEWIKRQRKMSRMPLCPPQHRGRAQ